MMITHEQIKAAAKGFFGGGTHAERVKRAIEKYENSKWIKFDQEKEATWPGIYETFHSYTSEDAIISDPVMTDKGLAVFVNGQWRSIGWAGDKEDRVIRNVTKWCSLPNQ